MKWLHAPGHVRDLGPNVVKFAENLHPLVIDWSEAYYNIGDIRTHAPSYHHFVGPVVRYDSRKRPVGHDVVISVRKDADIKHTESFFISGEVRRLIKYFPERHGKAVVFNHLGVVYLITAWHPHPVPFKFVKMVLPKYRRGVGRVQKKQRELEEQFKPDVVLNGGDLQTGPGKRWAHPNQFAKRNGMRWHNKKIDWQMWKGKVARFVSFVTLDPRKINRNLDHPWTMLTLSVKKK